MTEYNRNINTNKTVKKQALSSSTKVDKPQSDESAKKSKPKNTHSTTKELVTNSSDFEEIKNENINLRKEISDLKKIVEERDKVIRDKDGDIDDIIKELNEFKLKQDDLNKFMGNLKFYFSVTLTSILTFLNLETVQPEKLIQVAKCILKSLGREADLDDVVVVSNSGDHLVCFRKF